jgi:hypothetical protein
MDQELFPIHSSLVLFPAGLEPISVVIDIYMGIGQGISLCSYLYLKVAKMACFSYYLLYFLFYKIREEECRIGSEGVGSWHQWERGGGREKGRRMNMVQIMYTHICKCKNDTC